MKTHFSNIKLTTKDTLPDLPITDIMRKAYKKMMDVSAKYDGENPTTYGKRAMRVSYDHLDKLCKSAGLKTLDVCAKLSK